MALYVVSNFLLSEMDLWCIFCIHNFCGFGVHVRTQKEMFSENKKYHLPPPTYTHTHRKVIFILLMSLLK